MSCSDFRDMFLPHLDGELSEADNEALLEHLNSCDSCRAEFNKISSIYLNFNKLADGCVVNKDFTDTVMMRIEHKKQIAPQKFILIPLTGVAALFIGFILGTSYLNIYQSSEYNLNTEVVVEEFLDQFIDNSENNPYSYQFEDKNI